ncbi:MAG: RluA family pseudouridine synthase [Planctomycetota bacterium]|jgi:tRNA pseudouridine32 synthase/23S rRNA pseudouridine746 synthase/23S rRNA pseudouridine1911/1915/1917 synthase
MQNYQKNFKKPPKKYQPKGISIEYEDRDIIVIDKTGGLLTISTDKIKDNTVFSRLNEYVRKGNSKSKNRAYIVHRLDKDTSGILVLAKNEKAKHFLQENWESFSKKYYAIVLGTMKEKEGIITSYLTESSAHKMYSVNDPKKGKLAKTGYKVLKEANGYSLLEIDLLTGRKNQIRVHLADKHCPVVGDRKYGEKDKGSKRLALHAFKIELTHPFSKEKMSFEAKVPGFFNMLLSGK